MAKTKFFRVAVEGETVDGRQITKDMIQQAAETYDPQVYTARINCEHLRGYSPEPPFNSWGSVSALKAEQIELTVAGKKEKLWALFAQLDVNDQAKAYNDADQKIFSSIELQTNFRRSNKAYLVGFAVTDSPASIGTEVLKFSRDDARKGNVLYIASDPISIELEEAGENAADVVTGAFSAMKSFFSGLSKAPEPAAPVTPVVTTPAPQGDAAQFSAFLQQFGAQMETMGAKISEGFSAVQADVRALRADHDKLKAEIEKTPQRGYSARPLSAGGDGALRAEC